jgi:hypothetical protein
MSVVVGPPPQPGGPLGFDEALQLTDVAGRLTEFVLMGLQLDADYRAARYDLTEASRWLTGYVEEAILWKPCGLDATEWAIMRRHTEIGEGIVASIGPLAHLATAIRAAHERWDGGGYPDGLRGELIPLASRIVFACGAYDAMTADRTYRTARASADALREL